MVKLILWILKNLIWGDDFTVDFGLTVSFEEALSELEAIVKELESGNVNLDDAINKYGEAMKLVKVCEDKIKNAEDMVVKIVKDNKVEDFEVQNESNE